MRLILCLAKRVIISTTFTEMSAWSNGNRRVFAMINGTT